MKYFLSIAFSLFVSSCAPYRTSVTIFEEFIQSPIPATIRDIKSRDISGFGDVRFWLTFKIQPSEMRSILDQGFILQRETLGPSADITDDPLGLKSLMNRLGGKDIAPLSVKNITKEYVRVRPTKRNGVAVTRINLFTSNAFDYGIAFISNSSSNKNAEQDAAANP